MGIFDWIFKAEQTHYPLYIATTIFTYSSIAIGEIIVVLSLVGVKVCAFKIAELTDNYSGKSIKLVDKGLVYLKWV